MNFVVTVSKRVKRKETEKIDKYLVLSRKLKGDSDTSCSWCTWNDPKGFKKKIGGIGHKRKDRDHPDYSIAKIGLNTEKCPEETCSHLESSKRLPAYADVKNLREVKYWALLKATLGISLSEHIPREIIWKSNGVKDVIVEYRKQEFCWARYFARFTDYKWTCTDVEW